MAQKTKAKEDAHGEMGRKFRELAGLEKRNLELIAEEKNDPKPVFRGKLNNWAEHWPDDWATPEAERAAYERHARRVNMTVEWQARKDARDREWASIAEKQNSIIDQVLENGKGRYRDVFRGIAALFGDVEEHAIKDSRLFDVEGNGIVYNPATLRLSPLGRLSLNLGSDAAGFLVDYITDDSNPEPARIIAMEHLSRIEDIPGLEGVVDRIVHDGTDYTFHMLCCIQDRRIIRPLYEYPATPERLAEHGGRHGHNGYVFHRMGKAAAPSLLEVINSYEYGHKTRSHAAVELRKINDKETIGKMLGGAAEPEYAAKVLRATDDTRKVGYFFGYWRKIDENDWLVGMSVKEAVPKAVDALVREKASPGIRKLCYRLLLDFAHYESARRYEDALHNRAFSPCPAHLTKEQYGKLLDCFERGDYPKEIEIEKLLFHAYTEGNKIYVKALEDMSGIASNPEKEPQLRIRAIDAIRKNSGIWFGWNSSCHDLLCDNVRKYFGRIGSRLLGWRREPDADVRRAARQLYSEIKNG